MGRPTLKREDDREEPSPVERALSGASAVFAVVLVGYMVWHGYALPEGPHPEVRVVDAREAPEGLLVTVEAVARGDAGLLSLVAEVVCDEPPPQIEFQNLPSGGTRRGTVVCPAEAADPEVRIASWRVA